MGVLLWLKLVFAFRKRSETRHTATSTETEVCIRAKVSLLNVLVT